MSFFKEKEKKKNQQLELQPQLSLISWFYFNNAMILNGPDFLLKKQ